MSVVWNLQFAGDLRRDASHDRPGERRARPSLVVTVPRRRHDDGMAHLPGQFIHCQIPLRAHGSDQTKSANLSETHADRTDFVGDTVTQCRRQDFG